MFNCINTEEFGNYLKELRNQLNISQLEIRDITGINTDTIRRIESGKVIPRYETLSLLSQVYKIDLIKKFADFKTATDLIDIYSQLDTFLLNYDIQGIKNLNDQIASTDIKINLINPNEFLQLKYYLNALIVHLTNDNLSYSKTITDLTKALQLTVNNFSVNNFHNSHYNPFELRLLILYSLLWSSYGNYDLSNKIYKFIISKSYLIGSDKNITTQILIKAYFNISYNYHMLYKYSDSLDFANKGINIALSAHLYSDLYALYYRKFTAEINLGIPTYLESLRKCVSLMDILSNRNLLNIYINVTKAKYDIDIKAVFPQFFLDVHNLDIKKT